MFLSCRPFVIITTLSTGLVGVEVASVSWLGQLTVNRTVHILVNILDGTTVENKGKLILGNINSVKWIMAYMVCHPDSHKC